MMSDDLIQLQAEPIDAAAVIAFVAAPQAGGIDVFLGTTREERHADGRELIALDYEAYEDMAVKQLRDLAAEARRRWPVVKLAIVHRTGWVKLAEPSVVIAVACAHRGEAFDACRWIIDTLKKDVAIWKKEVWSDGSGSWVHP
jgi:molybdopterin synthase catalytic subunit